MATSSARLVLPTLDRQETTIPERCAGREKTITHSSASAFCSPEQLVLSCVGVEGGGLVLRQLQSAFLGRVPSLL